MSDDSGLPVPDRCPHGYGPIDVRLVDISAPDDRYPWNVPGELFCPPVCPERAWRPFARLRP